MQKYTVSVRGRGNASSEPRKFYFMSDVLPDDSPDESKQQISAISKKEFSGKTEPLIPDSQTSNLIKWFADEQKLSEPDAVKRAVSVAAYIHDVIANKGGKVFIQLKDGSYLHEVKEAKDKNSVVPLDLHKTAMQAAREKTRTNLATFLTYTLGGTIATSFILIIILVGMSGLIVDEKKNSSFDKTSALAKDLITFILTAQTGLIGTALGFYFSSKENSD
ncbi:hypothetical protein VB775_03845 [Pseudanabaena sp. CCNP1317]|nr:hypothetical protein [Pseudanabaena sp. CCNP1317]